MSPGHAPVKLIDVDGGHMGVLSKMQCGDTLNCGIQKVSQSRGYRGTGGNKQMKN